MDDEIEVFKQIEVVGYSSDPRSLAWDRRDLSHDVPYPTASPGFYILFQFIHPRITGSGSNPFTMSMTSRSLKSLADNAKA
jgi:hypothetical protein